MDADCAAVELDTGRPSRFATLRKVVPGLLALGALVFVARDLDVKLLGRQFSQMDWRWMAAAIALDALGYCCQGVRWSVLLRSFGRLSPLRATQAVYVGLFANETLPFRAGEVARGLLAARWLGISPAAVIPSVVSERLLDGLWLGTAASLTSRMLTLPPALARAANWFSFALALSAVMALLSARWFARLRVRVRGIASGRNLFLAAAVSSGVLALQALAFWAAMRSCGLRYPPASALAVLTIIRLGTLVPSAPANVGTYQFFCSLGLELAGVPRPLAVSFSVVVFVVQTLSLWAGGAIALAATGVSFESLRRGSASKVRVPCVTPIPIA